MKILVISHVPNDENAGASRIYHLLAQGLRQRGHTVKVLHYEDLKIPGPLSYLVKRLLLPEFICWRFYREATQGYDVVFASNGAANRIFSKLRRLKTRPLLVNHLHGASHFDFEATFTEKSRGHVKFSLLFLAFKAHYATLWDLKGVQSCDVVVTQSTRDQDYLIDRNELDPTQHFDAPVVRIPAALHPSIEKASQHAVPPAKRDPMTILWFGTWGERKGHHYVNRAFREVKAKFPKATLTLGGTGMDPEIVRSCFDTELRSSLRVLPKINIEAQLLEFNRHSIFIFPSLSEGFGLALVEAMAMGLACVTTATGMMGDWVTDRKEALLVPMASSTHLAQGILELMEDDALRLRIAAEGQSLARTFTLDRFMDGYLKVFEEGPAEGLPN
jgi:glycosyltransferase involved in cell wall biosynthesis